MLYGVEAGIGSVAATGINTYVASAVHFDGSIQAGGPTFLQIDSLSATDNGLYSFSMWVKGLCTSENAGGILWIHDAADAYDPSSAVFAGGNLDFSFFTAGEFHTRITGALLSSTSWHNIIFSADLNHTAGSRVFALYIDRNFISYSTTTGVGDFYQVADAGDPITETYNAKSFVFGDDSYGDGPLFDVADVWMAPGVSLLSGTTIPTATLNQFIDIGGKPVDPTGWPIAPVKFYGNSTDFATNRGTGGAASLTGTLTPASTHP